MLINRLRFLVDRKSNHLVIAILIFGFVLRLLTIFRAVGGDEAVILYYAWMIVRGKILYRDLFDPKPPGVFFTIAFIFLLFGKNIIFIRVVSISLSTLTALILFKIGKTICNPLTGIISALLFELEPISLHYSTTVSSETFMVFCMVIAVYFYILAHIKNNYFHYFFVGIFIGLSALMKQLGIILLLVILFHRIYSRNIPLRHRLHSIGTIVIGLMTSVIPVVVYFLLINALGDAVYASLLFNLSSSHRIPILRRLDILFYQVFLKNAILWIVGIGGALFAMERRKKWDIFLVGWLIASFLVIPVLATPWDHYYILGMPSLCLFGGILTESLIEIWVKREDGTSQSAPYSNIIKWFLVSLALSGLMIYGENLYQDLKYTSGLPYQLDAATYIKTNTSSDEIIFSPDPTYYLLTDRENKYKPEHLSAVIVEAFGINDLPQYLENGRIRYVIMDEHIVTWTFNEDTYRRFFDDETRAVEVKNVYEWILENYALEVTFGSGIDEVHIYHSRFW